MSARKLTQPATSGWTSFSSWSKSATGAITLSAYAYPAFRMLGTKWVPVDPTVHPRSDPAQPFSAEGAVRPIRFGTTNARLVELELDKGPVTLSAPAVSIGKPHLAATGLTYSSIASDADLQYAMSNTGVEASIVLRSSKAPRQYTFHIADTGGQLGNVQAHPDGSFEFGGRIDGDVNIALAAPMAFEEAAGASGGPPAFDRRSAAMTVTKVAGGFDVTVGVRSSWIAGKTFPIELDPSVYFTEASPGFIAGYSADAPYACGAGCGLSQSGNLAAVDRIDTTGAHDAEPGRSFYRFDLSKIPQGATVSEAHFQQALIGCPASNSDPTYVCTQNNYVVELHPMTGAWDGTATWASLTPLVGSSVISSLSIPGFNCYYCYTTEVWSGLAPAVQGWVNQPWTNFGFAAKLQNESPNVGGPIWAFRNSSETPALCLHITYTPPPVDPATLRAGGSASSNLQPCSQGGNPVNCDTGSFWHTLDELKVPGRGVPLHFNLTYDSSLAPTATSLGFGWTDSYNMNLSNDSAGDATIMQENGAVASFVPASGGCNNVGFTTPIAAGSAAGYQSLAADCSGHVWVWGANNDGQLGDGTTTNHATPEMLTSLSNIIGVAGGTFHSLALGSDGTVWSWGDNSDGELGNGTTTQSLIPVHLSGISGVVAIAAGYFDSLALRNDGSVWAWGNNASGELGNGSTTNSSTPVQVSGLANVTSIAAAGITSLALKSGGTVWAWGDNSVGQVGNGSLTNSLVPVQAFSNATAIAGGYLHSMAIRSDGTVWTWGYNSNGQLGNGSTTSSTLPVEVSGLSAVTAIAGGAYFSLALKNDGTLWGWGDNSEGQLGANVLPGTSVPVQCCPNNLFGAIAAGGFHSLGLNASGAPAGAFGWGWNHEGEVGDGTTTTRTQPVSVNLPSGGQFAQPGGGYVGQHVLGVLSKEFDGSYVFYRSTDHGLFMFSSNGQLATESDLSGNRTTLTYNSAGQLTTVTDPANRALTLAYSGGNLQSVTDPAGRSVTFGYDGTNQLTLVVDPNGGHTQFTYNPDGSHLVRAMERPRQAGWVTNTYDSSHRVTLQTDEMQRPTTFDYTSIPGATKITDPSQNVTVQQYQNGELTSLTKGFGTAAAATWSYLYDSVTLGVAQITDPNRHVTKQTWDPASGMLTSSKDPLLRLTLQTWNPTFGFLTSRTDAKGVATTFTYDSAFNVLNSSTPQLGSLGQVIATRTTAYQYGQDGYPGDLTTTTDPDGKAWKTGYDAYGDVTTVTDPLGDQTTYGYGSPTGCGTGTNGIGLRTSMVSPRGNAQGANPAAYTTAYQYDCLGDLTRVRDPLWNSPNPSQHQVVRTYDADINLSSMTDGDGNTTSYTYDAADELKVVTRADNSAPTTDYNADGTVADQKDGKGNPVETYGYDSLARVITETDALGSATQYAYDPAGNQLTKQDSGGNCSATPATGCTTMGYDAANELTGIAYSDGVTPNVNNITYDADGQRTAMTDGTGSSSWSWDSLRRLTAYTDGHGDQVQYQYNLRGLVTQLTYPGKGNVTRGYDDAGRLALVQDWLGNKTSFGYDADNNLTAETLPPGTNEVDTTGYNAADQLTSISDVSATVTVFGATYGRDGAGQLVSDSSLPPAVASDRYTSLNQLCYAGSSATTACASPPAGAKAYSYDAADNLTSDNGATQSFNVADQLCWTLGGASTNACGTAPSGATSYSYDTRGNRTAAAPPAVPVSYAYDQANRLTGVHATSSLAAVTGSDGGVYVKQDGGSFSGLGTSPGGAFSAAPAVVFVPVGNGQPPVPLYLGVSGDHRVWVRTTSLGWQLLSPGAGCLDNVAATVSGQVGSTTLTVACQGTDHALYYAQTAVTPTSLPSIANWANLGGTLTAGPAVAVIGGTPTFFVTRGGGAVFYRTPTSSYQALGATCTGHPAVASQASTAYFACHGTDGALWYAINGGSGWGAFQSAGGQVQDGPGIAATAASVTMFVTGTNGVLYHTTIPPGGGVATPYVSDGGSSTYGTGAVGYDASATYAYNGDGLRMQKTSSSSGSSSYTWDPSGSFPVLLQDGTNSYVYGPSGLPVEQVSTSGTVAYLHHDQLGTTRMLSTTTGAVAGTYTFDAYGNTVGQSGSATTPLLYAGQYQDVESGLYYLRARYYDPGSAQFLSRDAAVSLTRSPYAYVAGNPLNGTDPLGLWGLPDLNPVDWVQAGAGAVGTAASTVWNHSIGSFDWGTTAAGAVNVIYGGYKIVTGVDEAAFSVALLFAPPPFDALAIPAGMLSVYQVTTGVAREVRGVRQLVKGFTHPATKCTVGDNTLRFAFGVLPGGGAGTDIWDWLGGAP